MNLKLSLHAYRSAACLAASTRPIAAAGFCSPNISSGAPSRRNTSC